MGKKQLTMFNVSACVKYGSISFIVGMLLLVAIFNKRSPAVMERATHDHNTAFERAWLNQDIQNRKKDLPHFEYELAYHNEQRAIAFVTKKRSRVLYDLGFYDKNFVNLNHPPTPVTVMALSGSRYREALDAILSFQKHFPHKKLIVFNIGLSHSQANQVRGFCNVGYRLFPFEKFPSHVRLRLRFYWKPLVLQLALKEFGAVLWIESSTRFISNKLDMAIADARRTGIRIFARRHATSTLALTHPLTLQYLPTDHAALRRSGQVQTAPMLVYNTAKVHHEVMRWYVLCALERNCMAPLRARRRCRGVVGAAAGAQSIRRRRHRIRYTHCHRFDQSVLNVLLKNAFHYRTHMFLSRFRISRLERGRHSAQTPKTCAKT